MAVVCADIQFLGFGTQRIEENIRKLFPGASMMRMDMDTTTRRGSHDAILRKFSDGEVDILLGTQMVAKGHHFPQLTLVGVIDADLGGADGDLRARERTFQLLHQVAGRAGRAEKPGLVLIQTRNPKDSVMTALASGDRDKFYEQERIFRERAHAPPFGRLAALILSGVDGAQVQEAGRALARSAPPAKGVKVWGPTPAFYHLLRGQTRERLLVQAERNVDVQAYLRAWLAGVKLSNKVRVAVDIDPVSFF